ncbi:hypothetical protein SAMN02983003_1920 [Devosia enhydra]|uniref:Uncharacterized protein n=1 Tax=Devosia enhydra TaxID=665118 RepID=A0A1K2HXC2_9HYPH|nr:hypothetical protein [Devosia enhydra]SFZ84276.1 hypothetical protein SAMN02983003_1920 [Devosia enhydra]
MTDHQSHNCASWGRLARKSVALMALCSGLGMAGLGLSGPVQAQSLEAIAAAEEAVYAAWEATPLTFREALFVASEDAEFGDYEARPDAVFAPGEPIIVYAEPVGFGWLAEGDGYRFGFDIDLEILSPEGTVLLEQPDFLQVVQQSRVRVRDFLIVMTLDLSGAEPGNYQLRYRARDIASDKAAPITLDFSVAEPEATEGAPANEAAPAEGTAPANDGAPAAPTDAVPANQG